MLDRLRGDVPAKRHNARTIAALTGNPGCSRRAVLDAAGVDKPKLAEHIGFPMGFGQSRFALARGNGFEAMLKADGCLLLLSVLSGVLGIDPGDAGYDDLGADDDATLAARHERTRQLLTAPPSGHGAAQPSPSGGEAAAARAALIDHPLLTLDVAGRTVFLEPDLIAFQARGRLHVVEIKSFAIVDDQADSAKVSAAAVQAAVYVLALRRLLAELGHDPALVSHDVVLVCPRDFSLTPQAVVIDVRKQLATLKRQLTRLASVSELAAGLPAGTSFDVALPPAELVASLRRVEARYAPECLSACELAVFCRHESAGSTAALGRPVRDALGGVETVAEALELAAGTRTPTEEQVEAAALLQAAARLRAEIG
ncbi:hypothetical protein [Actinoplanes sp. N902-109]|uniref:hypothetical protein n=1 Tax=Actinoplanes sp. (strain N902-109) TaxID=649831 RepID=UPI0003295EE5|nr:hypothetical protein [Actinoplanes sp. N902-109]AGL14740.1 secreted protein [Actinoplanes sp. N902-109]